MQDMSSQDMNNTPDPPPQRVILKDNNLPADVYAHWNGFTLVRFPSGKLSRAEALSRIVAGLGVLGTTSQLIYEGNSDVELADGTLLHPCT